MFLRKRSSLLAAAIFAASMLLSLSFAMNNHKLEIVSRGPVKGSKQIERCSVNAHSHHDFEKWQIL